MADDLGHVRKWAIPIGLALVCLFPPSAMAAPAGIRSPETILRKAADSGRGIIDFSARVHVEARIGRTRMSVPLDVYSKTPHPAVIKVLGIPLRTRRKNDLMVPTAYAFTDSGDYRFYLAGTPSGKTYQIEAIPKRAAPGFYRWTLTVSTTPWLITAMQARNEIGESTRVSIRYARIKDNLVPVRIDGQGDLLLKEMLPEGIVTWLYEKVSRNEPVSYRITFSQIRINSEP